MYNYHTELILKIDAILFIALIVISALLIVYVMLKEHIWKKRASALLGIKKNVYELALSGEKINGKVCMPFAADITLQQFLDVATNRNREAIFFNESEQKLFKNCFMTPKKIRELERLAKGSGNKWRRIEAILSLGYAEVHSAVSTLKRSLNGRDEDIAYFSMIALGQLKTAEAAKVLIDFLRINSFYRYKIVSILENFPSDIADSAIGLTLDPDPVVRLWAVRLFSKLKPARHLKNMEKMTEDGSSEVRAAACACLGELGMKEPKDTLVKCLADDSWVVRAASVEALSKVLGPQCLPYVMERINDGSLSVLDNVRLAISKHISSAIPYIEKVLSGEDAVAKRICVEALEISGYITKMLNDILRGTVQEKDDAKKILEGIIMSKMHLGLEGAVTKFNDDDRGLLLDAIKAYSGDLAEHIRKRMKGEAVEP